MCGFAGFLSAQPGGLEGLEAMATRMASAIAHRGPDDSGAWADAQAGIAAAPRQALADRGRSHACRRQTRQNGECEARSLQRFDLFVKPAKDAAIAALEADHARTCLRLGDKRGIDVRLACRGAKAVLTHIDAQHGRRNKRQDFCTHQPVMDHHLRGL